MTDDGVGLLRESLAAEEKQGSLWNLVDPSGPSDTNSSPAHFPGDYSYYQTPALVPLRYCLMGNPQ